MFEKKEIIFIFYSKNKKILPEFALVFLAILKLPAF